MWRHVVAQAARCACPAIRGGLPEFNDCSNQIINLFLLAHDDVVKLLQQVFGVGGFDFQISQALINVVGVVREIHERIGHEFENTHLVCAGLYWFVLSGACNFIKSSMALPPSNPSTPLTPYTFQLANSAPKRARCTICLRAQSACICHWITPVAADAQTVEVLILQHPLELHNAKNSARLLHLSLPHSRIATGEVFDEQIFQSSPLFAATSQTSQSPKFNILLYPDTPRDTPDTQAPGRPDSPVLKYDKWGETSQLRLIVLDGTWRKSRKILHLNPMLRQLPRLSLEAMPASRYLIRKAHKPDQLSTLEATCAALAQLERNGDKYQLLLKAFDGFVAQQLSYQTHT